MPPSAREPSYAAQPVPGLLAGSLLERALHASESGVCLSVTRQGRHAVVYANRAYLSLTGLSEGELLDRQLSDVHPALSDPQRQVLQRALAEGQGVALVLQPDQTRDAWEELRTAPVREEGFTGWFVTLRDVTDRERARQEAARDALTGLANRATFDEHLALAIARARRAGARVAVLYLDLDRFKLVNDTYGHGVGDEVLVQVARRLGEATRGGDVLARIGGDEFAMILGDDASTRAAGEAARRLLSVLPRPLVMDGVTVDLRLSIGVAIAPPITMEARELLRVADGAMYEAKRRGGDVFVIAVPTRH